MSRNRQVLAGVALILGAALSTAAWRSFNGPFPIQIMRTATHVAFLFEMGNY